MTLDPVLLSRIQFAMTVAFHYLFPPLTIGMGVVLVYLKAMALKTREPIYDTAGRFWTQIFAVTFAVGVASGIVMEFQFGTNWANYSRFVGDVFGSALAAEGIFAFFLESGFLAILVFGWDKVSPKFHFFATLMVSLGSIFSSVWIIVANSWQQTPAGHKIVPVLQNGVPLLVNGVQAMRAETVSFWGVISNPSTFDRLTHSVIGAFIAGAFFILSISAYYLLKGRHTEFARRSFKGALLFATVFSLLELVSGHSNARMVARQQPAKLAAMEAHYKTGPASLTAFGVPDEASQSLKAEIGIPGLLGFLAFDSTDAKVIGLDAVPAQYRPPVGPTYYTFHLMVALGSAFILMTLLACFFLWRKSLWEKRWLLWIFVFSVVGPLLANQVGWAAAEIGRQPWTVYAPIARDAAGMPLLNAQGQLTYMADQGLLTVHSVSPTVTGAHVLGSICLFGLIYALLFALWIFVLNRKIQAGPKPIDRPGTKTTGHALVEAAVEREAQGLIERGEG